MAMRGRTRRNLWITLVLGCGVLPATAVGCGDQDPDDSPDGGAGSGGGSNDGSAGSGGFGGERHGDGGTGIGDRDGGAGFGGRDGSGGALPVPGCLDDVIDESCEVAARTAVDGWNCALRFPRDSLGPEDGTSVRVFVACDEFLGLGGGAGSGGRNPWTFDHRTDTLQLGRDVCESAAEGTVVTAIAGCN
jgi:hypothetical protein